MISSKFPKLKESTEFRRCFCNLNPTSQIIIKPQQVTINIPIQEVKYQPLTFRGLPAHLPIVRLFYYQIIFHCRHAKITFCSTEFLYFIINFPQNNPPVTVGLQNTLYKNLRKKLPNHNLIKLRVDSIFFPLSLQKVNSSVSEALLKRHCRYAL